jgi:hypothetical protein
MESKQFIMTPSHGTSDFFSKKDVNMLKLLMPIYKRTPYLQDYIRNKHHIKSNDNVLLLSNHEPTRLETTA